MATSTKAQADLEDARVVCAVDHAEGRGRAHARSGQVEVGVVEQVEELAAQVELHGFLQRKRLLHRGVDVEDFSPQLTLALALRYSVSGSQNS